MSSLNSCIDLTTGVHDGVRYHVNRAVTDGSVYDYECATGYKPDGISPEGAVQCTEDHHNLIITDYLTGEDMHTPKCNFEVALGNIT